MNTAATMDLTPLWSGLATIITLLLTLAANWLRMKLAADTARSKAETAGLKIAALVAAMAGKAWDRLSPKIQAALADGTISPDERSAIEHEVQAMLRDFTTTQELEAAASALGLPYAALIAKISSSLIAMFTSAHDPDLSNTMSPLAFPVAKVPEPELTTG